MPRNYAGAWERAQNKRKAGPNRTGPAKMTAAIEVDAHDEHSETCRLWPVLPMPAPLPMSNGFEALADGNDHDDDETEVMKALAAITPKVTRISDRTSQKTSNSQRRA